MIAERVVHAFWPVWTILFAYVALTMFRVQELLSLELVWLLTGCVVAALLWFLIAGLRRYRHPSASDALSRLDARLPNQPIAAVLDEQAQGTSDPVTAALWQRHRERMIAQTREAHYVEPDLRVAYADPFGLRYLAILGFAVAVLFGPSGARPDRAVEAGQPVTLAEASWEGWIEPPTYTDKPTLYLADQTSGVFEVAKGARITIRFYGKLGALTLAETVSGRPADEVPPASDQQQIFTVEQDGRIEILGSDQAWDVIVSADAPPYVEVLDEPDVDAMGEMRLPFRAADDFGVRSGEARIELRLSDVDRRHGLTAEPNAVEPLIVDLPVPITGSRDDFNEVLIENFSEHVFANLPVTIHLSVSDALGQVGEGAPFEMTLPGRRFFEPVAKAVIEQRRDLLWSTENAPRVAQLLRAVSHRPEDIISNEANYFRLRSVVRQLEEAQGQGLTDETLTEIAAALWDVALQLEEGSLADALERLRRAQDRLSEAMRNGASEEEIQELMDELRAATDDYMRMLAERGDTSDGTDQPDMSGETREMSEDQLAALMDRIQELMNEGRMAEAQALMEQLNQLLENMRVTQGEGGNGPQSPGQQSLEELGETLREQQELSDEAFQDFQRQFSGEGQSGEGEDEEGETSLAERQEQLRDLLEEQRRNIPNLDGEEADRARRSITDAERSMDRAEQALRNDNLGEAIDQQAEALDALREGMRELGQALARGDEEGENDGGSRQAEGQRADPLGRRIGRGGESGSDESVLEGEDIYRRAGELLDEIRRRAAEQDRPTEELDYLKRLLERF